MKFEPEAQAAAQAVYDHGPEHLADVLEEKLDLLERHPDSREARRGSYGATLRGYPSFMIPVVTGEYDWVIIWHWFEGEVSVDYVGRRPGT